MIIIAFFLILVTSCSPELIPTQTEVGTIIPPTIDAKTETLTPTPFLIPATPNTVNTIESATMFYADFETNYPADLSNLSGEWVTRKDSDGNMIFCNEDVDDWSILLFGSTEWNNYAISLKFKFLSKNKDTEMSVLFRNADNFEGYSAKVWEWGKASLAYSPPPQDIQESVVSSLINNNWYVIKVYAVDDSMKFYFDGQSIIETKDTKKSSGRAGYAVSPNTLVCLDDIRIWGVDEEMNPINTLTAQNASPLIKYEGDCEFCFINGNEPSMPIISHYGWAPNPNDKRDEIVIDENFTVARGEEVVFEDKIVWVRPNSRKNMDVYGRLIFRNSLVLWEQKEHQQTRLIIRNGGGLIAEDTYVFSTNQFWVNWDYQDGSTIYLDNYKGIPWGWIQGSVDFTALNYSTVHITFGNSTHNARVNISNAHHVDLELQFPIGEHTVSLPENRVWGNWNIQNIWANTSVEIKNSYISQIDVNLTNDVHLTVENSPSGFGVGWPISKKEPGYVYCEVANMGEPNSELDTYGDGTYYKFKVWELPCVNSSLTLKNSTLDSVWPQVEGYIQLKILNSRLADTRNYGSPAIMEIYDSSISRVAAYKGGKIYIENSIVFNDLEIKDSASVIYVFNVKSKNEYSTFQVYEIDGGKYISLDEQGAPWK